MVKQLGSRCPAQRYRALGVRAAVACGALVCVVACGGKTIDGGDTSAGTGAGGGATGSGGGADTGGAGGTSSGSGGTAATGTGGGPVTCPSSCQTPALAEQLSSVEQVYDVIAGRWLLCGTVTDSFPPSALTPGDIIGVEFEPSANGSGTMHYLVQGVGGPFRGAEPRYQLTYDVSATSSVTFQINMHALPNIEFSGSPRSYPCPRQLTIAMKLAVRPAVLVPIP
jgi:hypothetical protein